MNGIAELPWLSIVDLSFRYSRQEIHKSSCLPLIFSFIFSLNQLKEDSGALIGYSLSKLKELKALNLNLW